MLSNELQKEFPGAKGYSAANLWRMGKDDLQKEFYIQMTKRYGWTKRVLINFVEAQTYEKYLLNQTNFERTFCPY